MENIILERPNRITNLKKRTRRARFCVWGFSHTFFVVLMWRVKKSFSPKQKCTEIALNAFAARRHAHFRAREHTRPPARPPSPLLESHLSRLTARASRLVDRQLARTVFPSLANI